MECFKYAFNILVLLMTNGIYSINPGGLQADLMGGGGSGERSSPGKKYPIQIPYRLPTSTTALWPL